MPEVIKEEFTGMSMMVASPPFPPLPPEAVPEA
jgi:hypothetical protein